MSTRLEVPKLKHAPTTLTSSLEDYLNDRDFEVNRRQYLAQQGAKKNGKPIGSTTSKPAAIQKDPARDTSFPEPTVAAATGATTQQAKGPAPDLIDFFESIEQNQQPMAQQTAPTQVSNTGYPQAQQYQQHTFALQQTGYNPFLQQQGSADFVQASVQQQQQQQQAQGVPPLQSDFTGAALGQYGTQPTQQLQQLSYNFPASPPSVQQNGVETFQARPQQVAAAMPHAVQQIQAQQTSSNPFRQSIMPMGASASPGISPPSHRQSTNPFARNGANQLQQPSNYYLDTASNSVPSPDQFALPKTQPQPPPPPQSQQSHFLNNSTMYSPGPEYQQTQQLQPQSTGTNPFARNHSSPIAASSVPKPATSLVANPTGSTNPFRQSAFVNHPTGQAWQKSTAQGTFSGFDLNNVPTVPVFPRPGQG